jgi:ribosomal protein L11 methyltransferase
VTVTAARAESARARMLELFPEGFEEVEHADGVELVAYTDPSGEERLWHAFSGRAVPTAEDVPEGWEERWRDFHQPVRVGPVWIGQPWQEPPPDAVVVVIDPGRAFGTGAHATTRLCLELLEEIDRGSLLDIGCGSGVLAIAGAKLGFAPVVALDHDAEAVAAARANAKANGVPIELRQADGRTDPLPAADVVITNITRAAVEEVGARVDCRALVTSGYLVADDVHVRGFDLTKRVAADGWAADLHVRRGSVPRGAPE